MSTHALRRDAAAPISRDPVRQAGKPRSGAAARNLSPADRLDRLSARLDELIRDVRAGVQSHRELERVVDEGEAIATGIRNVFRAATEAAVNPPLWQQNGKAIW